MKLYTEASAKRKRIRSETIARNPCNYGLNPELNWREMAVNVREIDGQRSVEIDPQGASVYLVGRGFALEFDRGVFINAVCRAFGLVEMPRFESAVSVEGGVVESVTIAR
ncbi:hypothetical protein [Agromyces larvae]|uniref:Uncharacterized protein n=1 Tax=Agromyces larvae TaxID=2929802 RepID=A0ABY4C702_9MICO|nr:hypothetical protein [Agromyces larvae]UOE45976.1 hypothetical protein MTO99_09605 [Agromyces larvae]